MSKPTFDIGDKVYVKDWGKQFTDFYKWENNERKLIWNWKTCIPNYSSTDSHWEIKHEPILTVKGIPYKDGRTKVVARNPVYKDYEYTILEKTVRKDSCHIYLLSSNHTDIEALKCFVQIGKDGLTTMTPEEQHEVQRLEKIASLQALALDNLSKWKKTDNLKNFPRELIKVLYDSDQNVLFGRAYTKGIVTYEYIPKEYTVDNKDLFLYSSISYNGKGCSLEDKDVTTFEEAQKRFNT